MKLKKLIPEGSETEQEFQITDEDKKAFFESIKSFNSYYQKIVGDSNLREIAEKLSKLAKVAEYITLNETDDWFDKITINKNMKALNNLSKDFSKAAGEMETMKQRISALFEDMGHILSRYFDIESTKK